MAGPQILFSHALFPERVNNENGGKMCKCTAARSHSDQASYRKAGIVVTFIVCGKAIKHQPPVVSASKGNTVRLQDKSLAAGKDGEGLR